MEHVCNLTDVDDKIIVKMLAEDKTLKEITDKYSAAFFDDLDVSNSNAIYIFADGIITPVVIFCIGVKYS